MIENFSKVKKAKWLLSLFLSLITITWSSASHLRAGQITIVRNSCTGREVFITITVYTNTASEVKFGEDGILDFGDGTSMVVPRVENVAQPQLGPNIGIATFTIRHTYAGVGSYLISYVEPNRNGGVLNMDDSFFTTFYLETSFDLAALGCNNSPQLRIPPIDQACAGQAFYHNPGAFDINPVGPADSLSYELVIPYRDRGLPVNGYIDPKDLSSESEGGGSPTFTINKIDGTMIWDAPSLAGEYNVAFNVIEWRKTNGVWKRIGYVRRDMQIIVMGDCDNVRPELIIPNDTCVVAGAYINKDIIGVDSNDPINPVRLQAFSEVFEFPDSKSPATIIGNTTQYRYPSPGATDYPFITFDWNTICAHIKGQAYDVVFKVTNDPPPYPPPTEIDPHIPPNLATFDTWRITVVAPAPVLTAADVPVDEVTATLTWDSYDCAAIEDVTTRIQIWRKVKATTFTPGICQTGIPESLGFTLIGNVPLSATNFEDDNNGLGLERGVEYCYRLVAVFPNRGAESLVSNEICIDPIPIQAPLITNVTVDETSETVGKITVSWIAPLNPENPGDVPNYLYQLERLTSAGFLTVSPKIDDVDNDGKLSFTDTDLNTYDIQYRYRVMLYLDPGPNPIDSSSTASSVKLDLTTAQRVVTLNWRASVPWSNQVSSEVEDFKHRVYIREGEGVTTRADFVLAPAEIVEVDVSEDGLRYVSKLYNGVKLDSTKTYCYLVETRGSYGNEDVDDPLINYSQINCAIPTISEPPCAPVIAAFADPCKDFFADYNCSTLLYKTTVRWSMPEDCEDNIKEYQVWQASTSNARDEAYDLVATVTDTFAVIDGLSSLAWCYKIKAIDRSDNPSEFSAQVCSGNCPNYELPNIFTPNGDLCNDTFSAFGVTLNLPEDFDRCETPDPNDQRCARFVDRVDFKVYNRWGKELFDYVGQRGNENTIYINWDGKDKSGKELATGIYYYSADVTFGSTDAGGKTVKTLKGWVHLWR